VSLSLQSPDAPPFWTWPRSRRIFAAAHGGGRFKGQRLSRPSAALRACTLKCAASNVGFWSRFFEGDADFRKAIEITKRLPVEATKRANYEHSIAASDVKDALGELNALAADLASASRI
jgi:hypothetical protein